MDFMQEYEKWLHSPALSQEEHAELESIKDDPKEIESRFFGPLEFGTAGLRGVLGAGTNRMNIYVVRQATQGLANWVKTQGGSQSLAISYDSRIKSDVFAREAARVLAGNGVKAYLYKELMPVPALSFATRHLHCDAGIALPLAVGHKYLLFVRPMEYMDLYQRTLPCREYQATTNATDATLYSFCLDRTQTRPLPTTPLTFQQVTEYDYLVYSQEALDHAKKFSADIRKHYGVTAK